MMINSLQWRLGGLTFMVLAILFLVFNDELNYVFDASGLSGKEPVEEIEDAPTEVLPDKGQGMPVEIGLQTAPSPLWNRLYCAPARSPLTIDGKANDWCLLTGRFLCNDCIKENSTLSAWMHIMFDDENLYIFSRVRQPHGLQNGAKVTAELTNAEFIQTRLLTDQAVAINIWRDDEGKGVVQLHYYMPNMYPRPTTKEDNDLFSAEDAIHRENGLAKGVNLKIMEHADQKGADFECAVPWKLLCIDSSARPKPTTFARMAFAAQLKAGVPIQKVQLKTNDRKALFHTFFASREPAVPPQIEVVPAGKPEETRRIFRTTLNKSLNRLDVDWSKSYHSEAVSLSELLVTPVIKPVTVDGADDEWPKTAEILIAERLSQEDGVARLKAAADDENLYVHAKVYDVTPKGNGNSLTLKISTDKIREFTLGMTSLTVDGVDALTDGAKVVAKIAPSHLDYSLEAAIPWKLITSDGNKPVSFAITGFASLNPVWSTASLTGTERVTMKDGTEEWWVAARTVDTVPDNPGPIVFASGLIYDIRAGIPETMSYFNGLAARFPLATWNPSIDVIPGRATVDGGFDDWDLSGGMFLCPDLHYYRDNNALWVHAMYDADNLYLLYRFIDSTPISNDSPKNYTRDDMAEFRMSNGSELITWGAAVMASSEEIHSVVMRGASKDNDQRLAGTIKTAFRKDPDGMGYVMEASIPWKTLGGPRQVGDSEPVYFVAHTTPRMLISDPSKFGSCVGVTDKPKLFGVANFRDKGPVTPRPCHLANGKTVPVVMRNGKPELDLSQLK